MKKKKKISFKNLETINTHAAGIDIGSRSHFVAVPEFLTEDPIREYGCFTADLQAIADWLISLDITTVAMESTGVYWIPLFEILESNGLDVQLVNAHHVKNVPGRKKTDRIDCKWIQKLHTFGLLRGSFHPDEYIRKLRTYYRHRVNLVSTSSRFVQHMQKALQQMNILLHNVVDDITGQTGMNILRAILDGERDTAKLAEFRHKLCKNSKETIQKSLQGNYKEEHLFSLKQAVDAFDFCHTQIFDCDSEIESLLKEHDDKTDISDYKPKKGSIRKKRKNQLNFDVNKEIYRITGVDLTKVDGFDGNIVMRIISETGTDMSAWPTVKHFTSWLSLCPNSKVSGGKVLSSKTQKSANRAATAFRLAANGLHRSKSATGAFLRRKKGQIGKPQAITATAHKLARIFYSMIKNGTEYSDPGQDYYEQKYQDRIFKNITQKARKMGYELVLAS